MEKEMTVAKERIGKNNARETPTLTPKIDAREDCIEHMGNLPSPPRHGSSTWGPRQTGRKPVKVQWDDGNKKVNVRSTRRRRGQRTTKPSETDLPEQKTAAASPKGKSEASGHPPERAGKTLGVPPGTHPAVEGGDPARSSSEEEEG